LLFCPILSCAPQKVAHLGRIEWRLKYGRYGKAELPKKPLILIVDDDDALRNATKGLMRALGFRSEAFGTAEDLLKFERLHRAACIIADMQMPQMTGLEMHRRLVGSGTSIPTILMTAYPDDSVRTRALEAGIMALSQSWFSVTLSKEYPIGSAMLNCCGLRWRWNFATEPIPFAATLGHARVAGLSNHTAYAYAFMAVSTCITVMVLAVIVLLFLLPLAPPVAPAAGQ
jgi:CheY-like chemotaxis protein